MSGIDESRPGAGKGDRDTAIVVWKDLQYLEEPEELLRELERLRVRVYGLYLEGGNTYDFIGQLYSYFLRRLAGDLSTVFAHHITTFSHLHSYLVHRLQQMGASMEASVLIPSDLKRMGLQKKANGPVWLEILLKTARADVLDKLFEVGDLYTMFRYWIIDKLESEIPVRVLRRLNLSVMENDVFLSALSQHEAVVLLQETHGPAICTKHLDDDRVMSAIQETGDELRMPIITDPEVS